LSAFTRTDVKNLFPGYFIHASKNCTASGDGIGPEVVAGACQVLDAVEKKYQHSFTYEKFLIGGCSIDAYGTALTDETLKACQAADAVLLGAVGGPKWDDPKAKVRPEQGCWRCARG
jgi:3-isopropylmalate dehydrogenase